MRGTFEIEEPEYICPVCRKSFKRYKALHGHMLIVHPEEFRANGNSLAAYGITFDPYERIVREIKKAGHVVETTAVAKEETR